MMREIIEAASRSWQQNVEGYDMNKQLGLFNNIKRVLSNAGPQKAGGISARLSLRRLGFFVGGLLLLGAGVALWLRRGKEADARLPHISPAVARSIELYRRLERVLESRGIARPASTPPLTHARALEAAGHPLGAEAVALTEIYVGVRFGNEKLDEGTEREFLGRVDGLRRLSSASEAA